MQADEVTAVQGHNRPLLGGGESQDFLIGYRLPGSSALKSGQHIVPKMTQFHDDLNRKVFVSVKAHHLMPFRCP
jgi:hypothetical protein